MVLYSKDISRLVHFKESMRNWKEQFLSDFTRWSISPPFSVWTPPFETHKPFEQQCWIPKLSRSSVSIDREPSIPLSPIWVHSVQLFWNKNRPPQPWLFVDMHTCSRHATRHMAWHNQPWVCPKSFEQNIWLISIIQSWTPQKRFVIYVKVTHWEHYFTKCHPNLIKQVVTRRFPIWKKEIYKTIYKRGHHANLD